MEGVELVAGHQVEHPQHRGLGLEVARDVEHEAAVAEARGVHDPQGRQGDALPRGSGRQQAAQGLHAVEDAGRRVAEDPDPGRRVDDELVRLGRVLPVDLPRLEAERDRAGAGFRRDLREEGTQRVGEERGLGLQPGGGRDRGRDGEAQSSLPSLERHGGREHGGQRLDRDVARGGVELELRLRGDDAGVPTGLRRALEGRRHVAQRVPPAGVVVEDEVRPHGSEAPVGQEGREVLDLDALAGRQAREVGAGHHPLEIAGDVLDGDPAPHGPRERLVQGAEVDRPAAAGQGLRVAVREGERDTGGARVIGPAEDVVLELPPQMQGGLGADRRSGEGKEHGRQSVSHGDALWGQVLNCDVTIQDLTPERRRRSKRPSFST